MHCVVNRKLSDVLELDRLVKGREKRNLAIREMEWPAPGDHDADPCIIIGPIRLTVGSPISFMFR